MPTLQPQSLELYKKMLTVLHGQPGEMTLDAIKTATGNSNSAINHWVEELVDQTKGHSPVMRTQVGAYALTSWARAMMDADPTTMPDHPEHSTANGTPDFQRQEQIIAAFVELLRDPPAGLLDQPSYAQMIQLLGATRHDLVADLSPASLQPSLEIALEQVDRITEGRVFFWPTSKGPPERVRVRGDEWFS